MRFVRLAFFSGEWTDMVYWSGPAIGPALLSVDWRSASGLAPILHI